MSLVMFNEGFGKRGGNLQKVRQHEKMRFHMHACLYATGRAVFMATGRNKSETDLTGRLSDGPLAAHRSCAPTFPTVHLAQYCGDEKAQAGERTKRADMTDRQQDA
jgi:hypothetical protein